MSTMATLVVEPKPSLPFEEEECFQNTNGERIVNVCRGLNDGNHLVRPQRG